ncbi:DUF6552 family protein [Kiloniella laminariae]|uniref:DUF6552 family protein n=1 Tax=Kiloniella laminariae TaxID=454162 RepID=UPI00037B2C3E|nr:DUF6552 family protein [Kiloniella laminariae]
MQSDILSRPLVKEDIAFFLKWGASIIQIFGYSATAFGFTPWNIYLFIVGLFGWFAVGVLWNDRAIMLIHIVAFAAMVVGFLST